MKILITHDGSAHSDAAIDRLTKASLPRGVEAVILTVAPGVSNARGNTARRKAALRVSRRASRRLKIMIQQTGCRNFMPGSSGEPGGVIP